MSAVNEDITEDTLDALAMLRHESVPIQGRIEGFTPLFDVIAKPYGAMRAAVFGKIWRYCQMKDGVCRATLSTISDGLGINRSTTLRHIEQLCETGYLMDLSPNLKNKPHIYRDTGKVKVRINMTVAESNSTVAQSNVTVAESDMSIDVKKDVKKVFPRKRDTQKNDELLITTLTHGLELQAELTRAYESKGRKAPLYFENIQQKEGFEGAAVALNGRFIAAVQNTIQRGRISRGDLLSSLLTWVKNEKKIIGDVVKPMTKNADGSMYV